MTNWKAVPLPEKMKGLPKDPRGYPIPFTVLRDISGKPHFQIQDDRLAQYVIIKQKCSICGHDLGTDMWMAGSPLAAFHPDGGFIDSPVHYECGAYALQVCPFLAVPGFISKLDAEKLQRESLKGVTITNPSSTLQQPPFFVLAHTQSFSVTIAAQGIRYIIPHRPFLKEEYWRHGERISKDECMKLLAEYHPFALKIT
jgi:hypothetical protein